jgi:starch-binding outer membrane protein, SusD/RagB family
MKMKKMISKIFTVSVLATFIAIVSSCTSDLLNQEPTTELAANVFWKTEDDATFALQGAYSSIRPLFDRDYYMDGHGEYVRTRGTSATSGTLRLGDAYQDGNYNPTGYGSGTAFVKMWRYLYGGVNRANYVIENVNKMLLTAKPESKPKLETIVGEAKLLRGMVYFRLISMWGDVPYISKVINDNSEVSTLSRLPIAQVKDSIMADFTYAFDKLPVKASATGRAGKPAALAFRGKLQLFWASWNKFGWPELDGFKPDANAATAAYTAAAADFNAVITGYGLNLFRNGDPGDIDSLGKADKLPNYYYLFTPIANNDPEIIMGFTHGGTGTGQGEELMRDVAGRSHEGSQCWVSPRYEIANRYQSTVTGEFAPKLIPINAANAGARTTLNSAVNPNSYKNRDYRMKSSIMWDYEVSVGMISLKSTGWCPFIYKSWNVPVVIDGINYTTYNTDGSNSGYVFRKFLRNYAGQGRSDGDYNYPVMRLADVFLMYAEATNFVKGPQADAIALVNRIRRRGNLPPLKADKTASADAFFAAIEQERIVELLGEGQRGFDLRRWRALERVWGAPYGPGVWTIDTHGANISQYYLNSSELVYQQNYIFKIPAAERDRNPNLTQNKPWL